MEKGNMDENTSAQQESFQLSQEQTQPEESQSLFKNSYLNLLLITLGLSVIGTLTGLGTYFLQRESLTDQGPLPCTSAACLNVAERFSAAMDPFSRPCDYFLFSCGAETSVMSRGRHRGKIILHNVSRRSKQGRAVTSSTGTRMDRGSDAEERGEEPPHKLPDRMTALLQATREILESPDKTVSMKSVKQKAQRFYKTCMDSKAAKTNGTERFMTLIQQFGGWPESGDWTKPNFNSTLAQLMAQYNTFPFFNVYVGPDQSGRQRYIQIDQPDFLIPVDWSSEAQQSKFNRKFLRPFYSLCRELLSLLNLSASSTNQYCGLYMSLSSTLVRNTSPLHYRLSQKQLYYRISIQELQLLAPAIDWLSSLQAIFHPLPVDPSDYVLLHNRPYIVYMSKTISDWLPKHEKMDSYPVHTYMILSLLQTLVPALDSRFIQTMKNFTSAFSGESEDEPHWKHCVLQTVKGFDTLPSHLIKEEYTSEEAEQLIYDVYSSFKTKVSSLNWNDTKTRDFVLNKINSLTPRLSTDVECVDQLNNDLNYTKVIMSENDYFFNYLQMLDLQQKWRRRLFSHTAQSDTLSLSPFVSGNHVLIPVGIFVLPFFHSSYPRAVNYGILGTLIAKDLLHLLLPDILSQSESLRMESLCVWWQYHKAKSSPTVSQQQELWIQYSALQIALQAYDVSLQRKSSDTSVSGLSHIRLFLTAFTQVGKTFELLNCDQHKNIIVKSGRDPGNVRPDITHQCLLMLLDSPLNRAGLLQVYIHTEKNALIEINPQTRIPRTFPRFCGLMVQLLHKLSVRAADGPQRLLRMIKNPVSDHLPPGCPRFATSFKAGDAVCPRTIVPKDGPAAVVIGAFAHGAVNVDYTERTVSVSNYPLSAALTCSKLCSAFEEVWGVL